MSLSIPASELISAAKEILAEHEKQKNQIKQEDVALANQLAEETKAMVRGMLKLQDNIKQAKTENKELPIVKDAQHALEDFLAPLTQAKENLKNIKEEKSTVRVTLSELEREVPSSDLIPKLQVTLTELNEKEKALQAEYNTLQNKYHKNKNSDGLSLADMEEARLKRWQTPLDVVEFTTDEMLKLYPDPVILNEEGEPVRVSSGRTYRSEENQRIFDRASQRNAVSLIAKNEMIASETEDILGDLEKIKEEWELRLRQITFLETKYTDVFNKLKNSIIEFTKERKRLKNRILTAINSKSNSAESFKKEIRTKLENARESFVKDLDDTIWDKALPFYEAIYDSKVNHLEMGIKRAFPAYHSHVRNMYRYEHPDVKPHLTKIQEIIHNDFTHLHSRAESKMETLIQEINRSIDIVT